MTRATQNIVEKRRRGALRPKTISEHDAPEHFRNCLFQIWGQCWNICLSIKEQPQDGLEHSVERFLENVGA
jgi:hypothetical protein